MYAACLSAARHVLLATGLRLFAEQGFGRVSRAAIATAAGQLRLTTVGIQLARPLPALSNWLMHLAHGQSF